MSNRPTWMILPGAIALFVLIVVPTLITIVMSLLNVNVGTLDHWVTAPFAALSNFRTALGSSGLFGVTAARSILISVLFSVLTTIVIVPLGVLAALSVNRKFRGQAIVRGIYLLPYVIPVYVVAIFARIVFLNQYGIVDKILGSNMYWLIGPNAFWAMLLTEIWSTWPFIYLMTLAGLQSIPREHYEAAAVDGAGGVWKLRKIVLPQLWGVLGIAILMSTLFHFGNFTLAFVMFSSPPPPSVAVLPIATYFAAFSTYDYGVASAISVITMAILIIPAYLYVKVTRAARIREAM